MLVSKVKEAELSYTLTWVTNGNSLVISVLSRSTHTYTLNPSIWATPPFTLPTHYHFSP